MVIVKPLTLKPSIPAKVKTTAKVKATTTPKTMAKNIPTSKPRTTKAKAKSTPTTLCYIRREGKIERPLDDNFFPCSNSSIPADAPHLCCKEGDECGTDAICRSQSRPEKMPHQYSPYYVGGCTDETYDDRMCRSDCGKSRTLVEMH